MGSAWASVCALGGIRTPNLLIRSQMLYPLSYERWTTSSNDTWRGGVCANRLLGGGSGIPGMGIEDLLGGRDLGDIKKAVGFVMENSDDFEKVLTLVRGLPDDAVGFLGKLPELLGTIGSGLADAGNRPRRRGGRGAERVCGLIAVGGTEWGWGASEAVVG